jgi:hypothetical protein
VDLAACVGVDFDVGDLACFTGDEDGVDGPRNEASRAAMAHGESPSRRGPCLSCSLLSLISHLSLMTTALEENLLRSDAELKLDLVSRLSLH